MNFKDFKERYSDEIEKLNYDEDKKIYAFISKILFDDGSETNEEIRDDLILINDDIDFIWTDSKNESNISFVKILKREQILDDNFLNIISNMREYYETNKENLKDILDDENDNVNINYYVINSDGKKITNSDNIRKDFENSLDHCENEYLKLLDFDQLQKNYDRSSKKELFVEKGEIEIDDGNNILRHKSNNNLIDDAIICNISAKSLKNLYLLYRNSLLHLNLRFYKRVKSVDKDIIQSITNGDDFWFLNNGIYIICDNFEIQDNKLILNKFSIINGGQTTYNISDNDFDKDFFLICKIISIKGWNDSEKQNKSFELANKISIASNKQKPISNKDLIANLPEANTLKDSFRKFESKRGDDYNIFCETKKGDFSHLPKEEQRLYKKENIKSIEYFLQLYYCWHKLKPGTSKSSKAKLYLDKKELKNNLEYISNNIELFSEITFLHNMFKELQKEAKKKGNQNILNEGPKNFLKYFDFYMISLFRIVYIFMGIRKKSTIESDNFYEDIDKINSLDDLNYFINKMEKNDNFSFKNITSKSIKENLRNFISSISYDLIKEGLLSKYGNDDHGQVHNLVKSDDPLLPMAKKLINKLRDNTNLQQILSSILEV